MEGTKIQIHLTLRCNIHCAYCPIPAEKFGADYIEFNGSEYKNNELDTLLSNISSLLGIQGAAISGGEPFLVYDRVIKSIKTLKSHFGSDFHIHLYTNGMKVLPKHIEELSLAGLDELRVNSLNYRVFERLAEAPFDVVCEIPCIPREGYYKAVCRLTDRLPQWGVTKLNLNELEVTQENISTFQKWNLNVKDNRVPESRHYAELIRTYALRSSQVSVFFCSFENAERIRIARNRVQQEMKPE